MSYYPATDEFLGLTTYQMFMNRLRVGIGGKAGEMEFCGIGSQTLGVGFGFADGSDFGNIRMVLLQMAAAGMFGSLGANMGQTGESFIPTPEMQARMDETFHMVLDEVRMEFRLQRKMGEALIEQLMTHEELLANEVEAFFNEYGYYTPKASVNADEDGEIVIAPPEEIEAGEVAGESS